MKYVRLLAGGRVLIAALGAIFVAAIAANAAGLFQGLPLANGNSYCSGYSVYSSGVTVPGVLPTPNQCNSTVPAGPAITGNELIPADTGLTASAPATVLMPSSVVAGSSFGAPRNMLGNGSLNGTQVNGTSTVTGATTSTPTYAALGADRWLIDTNVTSGTGSSAIVTSSPTPPAGFTNVMKVYRAATSSLGQPICAWQAVPSYISTQAAGLPVTFSAYIAALAGLSADNGNAVTMVVTTGTGTDQGLNNAWTASPAITQAWTGIATTGTQTFTTSTTFNRYQMTVTLPTTETEIGVAICFTPTTASGNSGTTDGFAFTGAQLEQAPSMSRFEVRPKQAEAIDNDQFVFAIHDTASVATVLAMCTETTSATDASCWLPYPVPMYKAPTVTLLNCGSACFAMPTTTAQTAVTSTCVLTLNATFTIVGGTNGTYLQCAQSNTTAAVGLALPLLMSAAATNSGVIIAWTGF